MFGLDDLEKELEILYREKERIENPNNTKQMKAINNKIKRVKRKIKEEEELKKINFEDIIFKGGKVVCNKKVKRIQFIFENVPNDDIVDILASAGFKESNDKKIWERFIKKNSVYATKYVLYVLQRKDFER